MNLTYAWLGEVVKSEPTPDGDLLVYGKATGPDLDSDLQICDPAWLRKAMPAWAQWGNIREQHTAIAAGVGVETAAEGDDWFVKALVTDKGTAHKVTTGTLKGYSIGIRGARIVKDAGAPGGRIVDGEIVEISLVDRPANPTAKMAICKAAGGNMRPVDGAGEPLGDDPASLGAGQDVIDDPVVKAVHVDGRVPAPAVKVAAVRTVKVSKVRRGNLLGVRAHKAAVRLVQQALAGEVTKADESGDIAGAWAAISQISDLIISEATELKAGRPEERADIELLTQAVAALQCFISREADQGATPDDGGGDGADDQLSYVQLMAKYVTAAQRRRMGRSGVAMPNGDFPIPDIGHLRSAIGHLGNYQGDKAKAKAHIIARARALNATHLLPDDWHVDASGKAATSDGQGTTSTTSTDVTEIVKAAVAEATRAHEAELAALRAQLAKVLATPIPGGPVLVTTPTVQPPTTQTAAARYRAIAAQASDPNVALAYRALAAQVADTH